MLPTTCDLELTPGKYCGRQPVTHYALSATTPELWDDTAAGDDACLAGFCSTEHAQAEPKPSLRAAKATATNVSGMTNDPTVTDAWQRLTDAYPNPVPVQTVA